MTGNTVNMSIQWSGLLFFINKNCIQVFNLILKFILKYLVFTLIFDTFDFAYLIGIKMAI
jgi:hypothetical protein